MASHKGFTVVEILISVLISGLLVVGIALLSVAGFGLPRRQFEQARITEDGRVEVQRMSNAVRNAHSVSLEIDGQQVKQFWLVEDNPYSLALYTTIDVDADTELVRYYLEETDLKRSVIQPDQNGNYPPEQATTVILARSIRNFETANYPLFTYNRLSSGQVESVGIHLLIDATTKQAPPAAEVEIDPVAPRERALESPVPSFEDGFPTPSATPSSDPSGTPSTSPSGSPSPSPTPSGTTSPSPSPSGTVSPTPSGSSSPSPTPSSTPSSTPSPGPTPSPSSSSSPSNCQTVRMAIIFGRILNRTNRGITGNMRPQVVLPDGSTLGNGEPFDVVVNGTPVNDAQFPNPNSQGLTVYRKDGSVTLTLYGGYPYTDYVYEVAYGAALIEGATIKSSQQIALEHQGDGRWGDIVGQTYDGIGYGHNDEFIAEIGSNVAEFYFGVGNGNDGGKVDLCAFTEGAPLPTASALPSLFSGI